MTWKIRFQEETVRLITLAVYRAITQRFPLFCQENHLETNNYRWLARGDVINQCLREILMVEGVSLHAFRRHGWDGRLIIDQGHHISYNVISQDSLDRVMKTLTKRNWPHYVQTMLFVENADYDGMYMQECMFEAEDAFTSDTYDQDFNLILSGMIENPELWDHYIIVYKANGNELKEIKLVFLNKDFIEITEGIDLMAYAKPDLSTLTAKVKESTKVKKSTAERAKSLTKLKPGIKPELYSEEDEA